MTQHNHATHLPSKGRTGYKAAGWYIRTQVPPEATILATHGAAGMEYPCATYYTGRHVAAAEDTTYEQECGIIEAIRKDIDVAIVEPRYLPLFVDRPDFTVPVRILRDAKPILYVAARRGFQIPRMDVDVVHANRLYDRQCRLRRAPTMIRPLPRTSAANQMIPAFLREAEATPESVAASADGVD